jgi:hypothetical protein
MVENHPIVIVNRIVAGLSWASGTLAGPIMECRYMPAFHLL